MKFKIYSFRNAKIIFENDELYKNDWSELLDVLENICDVNGIPNSIEVTENRKYRNEYPYRINDVEIIRGLFELGYRIGAN